METAVVRHRMPGGVGGQRREPLPTRLTPGKRSRAKPTSKLKRSSDRATRGKERNNNTVRARMVRKEPMHTRTELATLLKVGGAFPDHEYG